MKLQEKKQHRHKGIYLLPNLLTTASLFAGFYSIMASIHGRYEIAAIAIFIAIIGDGMDGRIARMTNTASDFGAEYDSLSDMVCFGLAPALVVYEWSLMYMAQMGWGKLGWVVAFFYTATAALRLARFNAQMDTKTQLFFKGLPSPAAAGLLIGMVWVADDLGVSGDQLTTPVFFGTLMASTLMVSNIRYYSFKDVDARYRVPFIAILVVVLGFMLASIDPPKVILGGFIVYAVSGPVLMFHKPKESTFKQPVEEKPKPEKT